jgi:hypothetical protein
VKNKIFIRSAVSCVIITAMFILTGQPGFFPVAAQTNQQTKK